MLDFKKPILQEEKAFVILSLRRIWQEFDETSSQILPGARVPFGRSRTQNDTASL